LKPFTLIKFWFELSHDFKGGKVSNNVIQRCSDYFQQQSSQIQYGTIEGSENLKNLLRTLYARGLSQKNLEIAYYSEILRFNFENCDGIDKLNVFRYIEITKNLQGIEVANLKDGETRIHHMFGK
jgi:hypothetical protein